MSLHATLPFDLPLWVPENEAEKNLLGALASLADGATAADPGRELVIPVNGVLPAGRLRSVCTSSFIADVLCGRRLLIRGARVEETLDLSFLDLRFPLTLEQCTFDEPVRLNHASFTHLTIKGGTLHSLDANGVIVTGDLDLSDMRMYGRLSLQRARVRGNLRLNRMSLLVVRRYVLGTNPAAQPVAARQGHPTGNDVALDAANVVVGGTLEMKESLVMGEAILHNARIRGDLNCSQSRFVHRGENAFTGSLARVGGDILMRKVRVRGETVLMNADCRGDVRFSDAYLFNGGADALSLDQARIRGSVFLRSAKARGSVRLPGALVGMDLDCRCATFRGPHPFERAAAATPSGCPPLEPTSDEPPALMASRARLQGNVYLNHCQSTGSLLFPGARIGGNFIVRHAGLLLHSPFGPSEKLKRCIEAEGATIRGSVTFDSVDTNALFDFNSVQVGRNFRVQGVRFSPGLFTGLLLENARVQGELSWTNTRTGAHTRMSLAHAQLGRLRHGHASWPAAKKLDLLGCRYATADFTEPNVTEPNPKPKKPGRAFLELVWGAPSTESRPLKWLALQDPDRFDSQPYEQLSGVYRRSGDDDTAKYIETAVERARTRTVDTATRLVGWVNDHLLECGHSTRRVWVLSILLVLGAAFLFGQAKRADVMTASQEDVYMEASYQKSGEPREYPTFNALMYSMDTFLPIIDLHQEKYWLPNARLACRADGVGWHVGRCGANFRVLLWIHIIVGWLATTLLVFSITGIMRYKPAG